MTRRGRYTYILVIAGVMVMVGCEKSSPDKPVETIRLSTTTSTENSGLLKVLLPVFQEQTGVKVQVLSMGTGHALRTARDGNCDIVLVHAPDAELKFLAEGWGVDRRPVMYNDFVVLGPANDPAGAGGAGSPTEALRKIASAGASFCSRGDNSGTHQKEQALWSAAGVHPDGGWYLSVGRGMGETLIMADQMQAYVLADRGTYLKFRKKISLEIICQGFPALHNPYSIMAVNPQKHPHVHYDAAKKLIAFFTSDEARKLIANYRLEGEVLFHPWPKDRLVVDVKGGGG